MNRAKISREALPILLCVKNVGPEQASVMAMLVEPHDDAALGLLCSDALGRVATQGLRRIDAREPDRLLHVGSEAQIYLTNNCVTIYNPARAAPELPAPIFLCNLM